MKALSLPCLLGLLGLLSTRVVADAGPAPAAPGTVQRPADPVSTLDEVRFVLGGVVSNGPIYFGQTQRGSGLRPMFALRWGRVRLSSSGAGSLIGEASAGGASTELYSDEHWNLRLGLRLDRGRRIKQDAEGRLAELPEVRGTLRARLGVSRSLGSRQSLSLNASPDLLGRRGGTLVQLAYYRELEAPPILQQAVGGTWSLSAALNAGDDRYMNSYFGIPVASARYRMYEAEGGLRDVGLGLGWRRAFGEQQNWLLFAGVQGQRLLGPAADAPFVQRRSSWSASLGMAYRR